MPRTYIRKKIKTYTPQDLAQAIEKVKNGELTQYSAAQEFKIPMTTLYEHVKNRKGSTRPIAGRPTVIPLEEEKKLAETVIIMEKWGFGLSRFEIMEIVAEYVRVNNIQTPFKDNVPGTDWFINFRKRHRLSIKKAQPVEFVRKKMTDPFVIAEYFDLLKDTLKNLDLFESPQFIWNLDETSLCLDPSKTKVVGQINKPCARTTHGSGKENVTVLTGVSANGKKLPPLIVFKGKFVWDQWMAELDDDVYDFELSYAASTKGWMETEIFYNYLEKVLIPNLGEERPVLIIYDGHSTHVDVRVVELAIRNRVTILKLPPHTSHLLQPLDISVFKSFKLKWDAKLVEWQRRNIGTKMPKMVFAKTLADTWQETSPDIIKSGFKKAGIYPFNSHVIPVDKYDPDIYKRYQKKITETHLAHAQPNSGNPKSLKEICIDLFNNQFPMCNDAFEKSNTNNVTLLSQLSKSDIQTLSFVAKHPSQLPICLQSPEPIQTQHFSKVNIISNIVIKKPAPPPLLVQPLPQPSCTFEELLLKKIKQDKKDVVSTKKKRVTKGAEVITAAMGRKILEEIKKEKETKAATKKILGEIKKERETKAATKTSKYCKKKSNGKKDTATTFIAQNQRDQPGPSDIKRKNKRIRQPSLDSTTSVSDIISEHSDSDMIDCVDFEELEDVHFDDFEIYNEEPISQQKNKKYGKTIKICEKLSNESILTKKDLNSPCTKGKGIGKKSKSKEKQVNKKTKENEQEIHVKKDDKHDVDVFTEGKNMTTRGDSKENDKYEKVLLELENKDMIYETQKDYPAMEEHYQLNDSVLVRYLIRKKWKYFIGFIEEIIKHDETYFSINFLKTMRPQQQLSFIATKRKDSDKVPESLIVKKINIQKQNPFEKEYYLCDDDDRIFFD